MRISTPPSTADVAAVVAAVSAAGSFLVVSLGLFLAWRQLNEWKDQKVAERRARLAEEIIDIVDTVLQVLRNGLKPNRITDYSTYESAGFHTDHAKLLRDDLAAQRSRIERLRQLGVRERAIIGDKHLGNEIRKFQELYAEILDYLVYDIKYDEDFSSSRNPVNPHWRKGDPTYYIHLLGGDFSIDRLQAARDFIEKRLNGYIRFE